MKLRITLTLMLLLTAMCGYSQLRVVDNKVTVNGSHTVGITPTWPKTDSDGNHNPKQALIVIGYDGFPENQIEKTRVRTETNNFNGRETTTDKHNQRLDLYYISLEEEALVFQHPVYGPTRVSLPKMKNKGIYSLTLQVDKRMDIDIEPLTDFESVKVYLDQYKGTESPAHFEGVPLGKHNLYFEFPDGTNRTTTIEVTPQSRLYNEVSNPELDMRKRMPLKIESNDHNVSIFVDDKKVADKAPFIANLPSGTHTIKAVSNVNDRKFDIATTTIKLGGQMMTVKLTPRERRKFRITGDFKNNPSVPMMLYAGKEEAYKISQSHAKGEQKTYDFDLPIGTKYKFRATYQGNEGKRTIKVTPDMDYTQTITIKPRHKIIWPWERRYDAPPVGITAAYTQKRFEVKHDGSTVYKGTLTPWDIEDEGNSEWLHGIKVGVQYQPTLSFGLGFLTGLFWEHYRSTTDRYEDSEDGLTSDFSKYQEHSLTMPVNAFYNFPFSSKIALALHGGINLNYMLSATYSGHVVEHDGIKYEDSYNVVKDKDNLIPYYPDAFQMFWEVGVQLRLGPVMLGAQITRPITKHNFEIDGEQFTTSVIKNSLSFTYVF